MLKPHSFLLLLSVFFLTTSHIEFHKFYVSVNQIDFNESKKRVEITSRYFIDDLNLALENKFKKKFYVGTNLEKKEEVDLLKQYLLSNMKIKINQKEKEIDFLSHEVEDDVLICYFSISKVSKISSLEIQNKMLFNVLPEQQNITNTHIHGQRKSALLTSTNPNELLKFD